MAKLNPLDTSRWTRDGFIREARLQTDAIQRLERVAAPGVLSRGGRLPAGLRRVLRRLWRRVGHRGRGGARAGCAHVRVLKVGTTNAKKNVEALMGEGGRRPRGAQPPKARRAAAEGKKRAEARAGKVSRKMDGLTKAGEEFSRRGARGARPAGRGGAGEKAAA